MNISMNKNDNYAKNPARSQARQKDETLREVMPQLGMDPAEPGDRYKTETKRKRLVSRLLVLCLVVVIVAVLAVYLFTPCEFVSLEVAEKSYTSVIVNAEVKKTPLLDSVTGELNGTPVPADQLSSPGSFQLEALDNGTLTVTTRSVTGRTAVQEVEITGIDTEPPKVSGDEQLGNNIYIYLEDEDSGINWDSVEVTGIESGTTYQRASVKEEDGAVRVAMPRKPLRVWVEDMAGNSTSLRLEPASTADSDTSAAGTDTGTADSADQDGGNVGGALAGSPFGTDSGDAAAAP